jgi:hypothetical protein
MILGKITEEEKRKIVVEFISLDNITYEGDKIPTQGKYNGIAFTNTKELINQYSESLNKALEISLNDENKLEEILKEFTNSIKYLNNIINGKHRSTNTNIAIEIK